jgi:hypothetical protein
MTKVSLGHHDCPYIKNVATLEADVASLKTGFVRMETKIDAIPQLLKEQKKENDETYVRKTELAYALSQLVQEQTQNKREISKLQQLWEKWFPYIVVTIAFVLGVKFL